MFGFKKMDAASVYLIYAGMMSLNFMLVFAVNLFYQATTVGLNPLQLVLVGTMLEATTFLFEIPTGVMADTYSRRLSVISGIVLLGAGILIQGTIPTFTGMLLAMFVMGIGYTFISGAGDAWITDEIGVENAGQIFIRAGQIGRVVGLVGIGVSVGLATLEITLPIILGGLLMLGSAIFLFLFMPENGFQPKPANERNTWKSMTGTFKGGVQLVQMRPILMSFILMALLYGVFSEGFDRLRTPHILDNFDFPTSPEPVVWFGMIGAAESLIAMGAAEIVRRRLDMNNPKHLSQAMIVCYAGMSITIVGFALSGNLLVALVFFWATGVLLSVSRPIETTWLNHNIDSSVRATVISMTAQTNACGQIFGGPAVGLAAISVSLRAALTVVGVLVAPLVWMTARASRQQLEEGLAEAVSLHRL